MTTPLRPPPSPDAQAVLNAYHDRVLEWYQSLKTEKPSSHYHALGMAAALRAAADRVPDPQMSAHWLYEIADELEGGHDGGR
jgi:hypothetical protein